MWFSYGWLQAKILSIFQAVFSALSSFFNGCLQIAILPPRTVSPLQWFCRHLQKSEYYFVFHSSSQRGMIPSESWPGQHGIELLECNKHSGVQRERPQTHFSPSVWGKTERDVTANHLGTREKWWNSRISHASFPSQHHLSRNYRRSKHCWVPHLWQRCSTRCNSENSFREITEIHNFWKLKCFMPS